MLIYNKDDIEFVTEFPCLLGHPVLFSVHGYQQRMRLQRPLFGINTFFHLIRDSLKRSIPNHWINHIERLNSRQKAYSLTLGEDSYLFVFTVSFFVGNPITKCVYFYIVQSTIFSRNMLSISSTYFFTYMLNYNETTVLKKPTMKYSNLRMMFWRLLDKKWRINRLAEYCTYMDISKTYNGSNKFSKIKDDF